jgi:proline racemase
MQTVSVIDSHTAGEPTRIVIDGGPHLGRGDLTERQRLFSENHDAFRRAIVTEPRGSDVLVGALLCEPHDRTCTVGVIFFNNVGYLDMCGHGLIGVITALRHLGSIHPGIHRVETPAGVVTATLHNDGRVSLENVPSFRKAHHVRLEVPGLGLIACDIAWGGNWFCLVEEHREQLSLANIDRLTDLAWRIRQAVNANGFPEVNHVELLGPPANTANHSRNFVLCPGKAYDRSPCGTGTSAKLACLAADGKLTPGMIWRQESIIGSLFEGTVVLRGGEVIPIITGQAWVTGEAKLILDDTDPLCWGFPSNL